jgi:DNA repair protein RecO (recombination protein O)
VVLSRAGRGDSDLVVTFITREIGLITGLAKNARQSIRRFGGNLLRPGTAAWYYFRQKPRRDLAFIERGEVNPKAPVLPNDPVCSALAAWALELVRAFEAHENPALASFNLLVKHLGALARTVDFSPPALEARRLSLGFTKCYLELAGFAPSLFRCTLCGGEDPAPRHWAPVLGGIVCSNCMGAGNRRAPEVPEGLLPALLATTSHKGCAQLNEVQLSAAEYFFQTLATLHSGRRFNSRGVINEYLNM